MHNLAYSCIYDSDISDLHRICEAVRSGYYQPDGGFFNCTEEELERIRAVLRRLSQLRIENPDDAEDLVQETLLTMVRKAPQVDIEKGLLVWAMGILRKKVGNYYRRSQRFTSIDDHPGPGFIAPLSAVCSPESSLHHAELCAMVENVLLRLSPGERRAVDLYLAGRETAEIVAMLRPERYQNIINWLHRGRKKLAKELARIGYERDGIKRRTHSSDNRGRVQRAIITRCILPEKQ